MLTATVVNTFKEVQHKDHVYRAGDTYPAEGFSADPERVAFLCEVHPTYKKIFLANVSEEETMQKDEDQSPTSTEEFPKHTGGGWYELSNGEKVQGKDEAIEAESALKSGE